MRHVAAGTSWLIQAVSGIFRQDYPVLEGDAQDFRAANHLRFCLCVGVPTALSEGRHAGINWDTEKVGDDTVRVTLKHDLSYSSESSSTSVREHEPEESLVPDAAG